MTNFENFNLDPMILKSLEKMNYKEPSAIQAQAIPLIQEGKDLIALAQTGSGKTAACAIPICNRVDVNQKYVQALIIVPTRELAIQYTVEVRKIGQYKHVEAFAIFGGEQADLQLSKLKHCVHVLVATPGRLIDFIYSRQIDLSNVSTLILDEADEMLSMGFIDDLNFIIQCLVHTHQTLLFSATMPPQIRKLAKQYMTDPHEVSLIQKATPSSIEHLFLYCHHAERDDELAKLIDQMRPDQCIIFCQSRIQVEQVWRALKKKLDGVDFLHAGLAQDMRTNIMHKFRMGKVKYLVATDVVARGLDFSNVTHVFNYQIPPDSDVYIHRTGRTGRYERKGMAISLVTKRELPFLKQVSRKLGKDLTWIGRPPPSFLN